MDLDPGNLSSQPYRKTKLSRRGCGRCQARQGLLTFTLRSGTTQNPKNEQQTACTFLLEDVLGQMVTERSQFGSIASKDREDSRTAPNLRKPSLQSSRLSVTTSRTFLTIIRRTWSMVSQSEWNLRPFRGVCEGELPHLSLKLKHSETIRKALNKPQRRSWLSDLYLTNQAPKFLDT